jgi:hypothetical protein
MSMLETFDTNVTDRVRTAVENTKRLALKHWEETLEQRCGLTIKGRKRGSFYELELSEIERAVMQARWYLYEHAGIMKGCVGTFAKIPGKLGIIALAELSPDTQFVTIDAHDREPGYCELLLDGPPVPQQTAGHTTLVLGPDEGKEKEEIIWTFHPGDPILPTETFTKKDALKKGQLFSRDEAMAIGFKYAKMV